MITGLIRAGTALAWGIFNWPAELIERAVAAELTPRERDRLAAIGTARTDLRHSFDPRGGKSASLRASLRVPGGNI
jgi:hypothetical protein